MKRRVNQQCGLSSVVSSVQHELFTGVGVLDDVTILMLYGRPQRWHAKGACVTPNKKERRQKVDWWEIVEIWIYATGIPIRPAHVYRFD